MRETSKCPFKHTAGGGASNKDWWQYQLKLGILRQYSSKSNPMGEDLNYAEALKTLNLEAFNKALHAGPWKNSVDLEGAAVIPLL